MKTYNTRPMLSFVPFSYTGDKELLRESLKTGSEFIVKTLLQCAEKENGNHRIYPLRILKREVEKYRELIPTRSYGELDHPDSCTIEVKNAALRVVEIWWEKDVEVWGRIKILNTPAGRIVKEILLEGGELGISSRGVGSVDNLPNGLEEVQDDFEIICWDIVSNPSTRGAWLEPIGKLSESTTANTKQNSLNRIDKLFSEILINIG